MGGFRSDDAPRAHAGRPTRRGLLSSRLDALLPPAPHAIEVELIGQLYRGVGSMLLLAAAVALIAVQAVVAGQWLLAALCAFVVLTALVRIDTVRRFHREGAAPLASLASARSWERRFAIGSYSSSAACGLANSAAFDLGDPVVGILVVGTLFCYVFLLVRRVAIRPRLCATSILIAVGVSVLGLPRMFAASTLLSPALATATLVTLFVILLAAALGMMVQSYQLTLAEMLARRDLTRAARKDPLTGLDNRLALRERFERAADGRPMAIHYLDLDKFKPVNDLNGHRVGDGLLCELAERLRRCCGEQDRVFRLGGDEFVLLQAGLTATSDAARLAEALIAVVAVPYIIDGQTLHVGVSVGTALTPADGDDLDELLASADAALYRAKLAGGGRHCFWTPGLSAPVRLQVA